MYIQNDNDQAMMMRRRICAKIWCRARHPQFWSILDERMRCGDRRGTEDQPLTTRKVWFLYNCDGTYTHSFTQPRTDGDHFIFHMCILVGHLCTDTPLCRGSGPHDDRHKADSYILFAWNEDFERDERKQIENVNTTWADLKICVLYILKRCGDVDGVCFGLGFLSVGL